MQAVKGITTSHFPRQFPGCDQLRAVFEEGSAEDQSTAMRIAHALQDPASVQMQFMQIIDLEQSDLRNSPFRGKKISAFEALSDLGENWVGIAAKARLIGSLDRIAFLRALSGYCCQRQQLSLLGRDPEGLKVSVNVHAAALETAGCADEFLAAVTGFGLRPSNVILELTEHEELSRRAIATVWRAHELGFVIYLDDFGEGGSTPELARQLPLDGIKLSLATTCLIDRDSSPVCTQANRLLRMARNLGVRTIVAEGIQRDEQLAILFDLGATHGQGWRFSQKCTLATSLRQLGRSRA